MTRKSFWLSIVLLPFLIAGLACGGGGNDDDGGDQPSDGGNSAPMDNGGGGDSGGSSGSDSGDSSGGSDGGGDDSVSIENCPELLALANSVGPGAFSPNSDNGFELTAEFFDEIVAASPDAIRDDMAILATAYVEYIGVLQAAGLDPSNPASFANASQADLAQLQAAVEKLDTAAVQQAAENIDAYFQAECS